MTAASPATFGSRQTTAGERTDGFFRRIHQAWDNFWAYQATIAELQDLTDRQLADLGLLRSGVRPIARRAVYGI